MSDCPTTDRLRSLLDGTLPEAEQSELQQHIDSCEQCQRSLEGLVAGKESWDGIARRLSDGDTPVSPALHEAINAAKELEAAIPSVKLPPGLLQPSEQPDSLGRLAHYEILQEVGSGGMGIVLKAFDTSLRRVVAIKVMAPHLAANAAARRRFVREAQAAAAVAHEHVVAIHAVSDQHDPPYLAMQFIEGKTLQVRLDKSGPLSVREVLRIGLQTASGLAAAHAQGLVHRDIKPANILLENGVERVKLTDFGLARAVDDASVTQSGVIAGTPLFMSPEQARGESIDHRSDLFSLGSVMYAMCVGYAPFRASTTMGVLKRVCDEPPRPIRDVNPDIPDWLTNIIDKLLAKKPSDRFQSAKEVAELLGQCLAHLQQPQSVPIPRALGRATMSPPAAKMVGPSVTETKSAIRWLTLPVIGLWGLFLILRLIRLMTWQDFLISSYLMGGWLLFVKVVGWVLAGRGRTLAEAPSSTPSSHPTSRVEGWRVRCTHCGTTQSLASKGWIRIGAASVGKRSFGWCSVCQAMRWAAVEWGELPPGDPSKSNAPAIRPTRIGLVTGFLGGMMTIGWLVQSTSHPVQGPAGVWLAFMCEVGLFLMALFFLLAGVLAGWNHGIREQPRTAGSMLRGFGFAAVCLTLFVLLTDNLAGRWKERRNECSVRFEVTRRADADLRFELSPTLIPARQVFSLPHNELLAGVPANGTINRLPPGEYQLRVHRDHRVVYSEPLKLYPGQWFTWPLLPSSLETFEKLQGRWQIVTASGNISTPPDDSISDWWIEFNEDRVIVSDAARSGVLQRNDLRFGIAPNSVVPSFDLIGHARGTFLFEGDRLTLRLANPGQPSVSTSDLNTTPTQIFCCRIVSKGVPPKRM